MYSRKQPEQPANQTNTMMETLLREDSQTLRRTNEVLEERVKASTAALKQSNAQLEKEVAERKQTEKRLQRRIAFDQILTAISSRFINLDSDGMDAGINEALADVAAFNQCDCAYIFQLVENGRILRNTHSWHNN
ncbi:MAG: hypothetical protein KC445_08310, partial [Anaerolineales bacterium]|nr:hypothetical protein [Anaerolineales bacterium]